MPLFTRPNSCGTDLKEAWSESARSASLKSKKDSEDSTKAAEKKTLANPAYKNQEKIVKAQNKEIRTYDEKKNRYFFPT